MPVTTYHFFPPWALLRSCDKSKEIKEKNFTNNLTESMCLVLAVLGIMETHIKSYSLAKIISRHPDMYIHTSISALRASCRVINFEFSWSLQSWSFFIFSLYYPADDWPDLSEILLFHLPIIAVCVFRLRVNVDCRRRARKICMGADIPVAEVVQHFQTAPPSNLLPKFLVLLMHVPGPHLFVSH